MSERQTPDIGQTRVCLGPFSTLFWEGSPIKIDYRRKGTLILSSLLEDLEVVTGRVPNQERGEKLTRQDRVEEIKGPALTPKDWE